jgi:hypothetical protein
MDKNLNKIRNLFSFTLLFSEIILDNELYKHSPDYILEKYNKFIGFEPILDFKESDNDIKLINTYEKIWKADLVKQQILYINNNSLNLLKMVESFEKYIGPIYLIKEEQVSGLHHNLEKELDKIIEFNSDNIKIILRDLRIKSYFT